MSCWPFTAVAGLKGKPAPCVAGSGVSCVAATNPDGSIDVVFWNYEWMTDRFPSVMPTKAAVTPTFTISQIGNTTATTYDLTTAKMNSAVWQASRPPIGFAKVAPTGLTFSFSVPYGNYGQLLLKPHAAATH